MLVFLLFIKNNYLLELYIPENSVSARKSSEYSQYWLQIIGILIHYLNYYFDCILFSNIISILFYFLLHVRGLTMNSFFVIFQQNIIICSTSFNSV